MNGKCKIITQDVVMACLIMQSLHLLENTEKNHKKSQTEH